MEAEVESSSPCESGNVVLVIDDSPEMHRLLRARLRQEDLEFLAAPSGAEGLRMAAAESPALILLDLDMPTLDGYETLRALKAGDSTLGIPVIVVATGASPQDRVTAFELGAVDFISKPVEMTETRARIRSALRTSRLLGMLEARAMIDGLTGLWNRAYFDERWGAEYSRLQRHGRPLSLAMLDADHFKSINDTFGHPAGDAVLQRIGAIIRREARSCDVACRYGGEEFAIIMPDTPAQGSSMLVERIRLAVSEVVWPRHPERKVTISAGIATVAAPTDTPPAKWIEVADRNLYLAKQGGRNRQVSNDGAMPGVAA